MRGFLRKLGWLVAIVLIGLALYDQFVRDPRYRTWEGDVFGVPYDFRPPTTDRLMLRWWNPDDGRVFTPHVFGVGWSVNLARLVELARERAAG